MRAGSVDRKFRFSLACEFMLRTYFARAASRGGGVRLSQDSATGRFLRFMGGAAAEAAYVRSELALHNNRGVSAVWLSDEFTLPLFAALAYDQARLLDPRGMASFEPVIEASEESFFGYRLMALHAWPASPEEEHFLILAAASATKSLLEKPEAMNTAFEACKQLAERGEDSRQRA